MRTRERGSEMLTASSGKRLAVRGLAGLLLALAIQLLVLAGPASAEMSRCAPYPCYHTAQGVLDWKPSMVRPYDVSGVPLAKTPHASGPGMLVGLDNGDWSYWDQGDLNAQGSSARGNIYHLSGWPYIDRLYYYSHNLLSVPPTVWTDAAHRQGVKVFATLTGDCDDLKCEDEQDKLFTQHRAELVDQLQKMAAAYGFDGWMIDIERDPSPSVNSSLMKTMSELSKRRLPGGARVEVAFYAAGHTALDSLTYPGLKAAGLWQSDYSYRGTGATNDPKQSYDLLKARQATDLVDDAYWSTDAYYYETENNKDCHGHTSANLLWNGQRCLDRKTLFANQGSSLAPKGGRYQAPSLYGPAWTMFGGLSKTTDQLPSRRRFEQTDAALWRGPGFVDRRGRCVPADRSANAVSSMVAVRPAIGQLPFVTRFDTGEGFSFSAQGALVHTGGWNLLSAQDPLPVAWCGQGRTLDVRTHYGGAYDGGSSLHVGGRAKNGSRRVYLYKAKAHVSSKTRFFLRYRTRKGPRPHVVASIDGVKGAVDLRTKRVGSSNGWVLTRAKLPARDSPGTLTRVGVGFGGRGDRGAKTAADIGELRIVKRDRGGRPAEIKPVRSGTDLSWQPAPGSILYYNVWARAAAAPCLLFKARTQVARYDVAHPLFGPVSPGVRYEVQPVDAAGRAGTLSDPPCQGE